MKTLTLTFNLSLILTTLCNGAPEIDIWKATGDGNLATVKEHIAAGTDIDAPVVTEGVPDFGGAPLHIAVLAKQRDIASLLIKAKADLNVKAKDGNGGTPLHWAAALGHLDMAKLLIKSGADVNAKDRNGFTPLDGTSTSFGGDKAAQGRIATLLKEHEGKTKAELPAAPTIDLFTAVLTDNLGAVRKHIAAGSDLNSQEPAGGSTPLNLAAVFGKAEAALALIDAGAKLEIANNEGKTALHNAAFFCHPAIVQALLDKGADINTKGKDGNTPLKVVSSEWTPTLQGIYQAIYQALGLEFDAEKIKKTRPEIAKLLRKPSKTTPAK